VVTNDPPAAPTAPAALATPAPPAAPPAEVEIPRPAGPVVLSPAEVATFGEAIEDLRGGVRPFSEQSVGICRCEKSCGRDCEEYVGLVANNPPEGNYQVRAALHTPRLMPDEMLQVKFEHACEVTIEGKHGTRTSTDNYDRTFQLGKSNRKHGYRLAMTKTFEGSYTLQAP